MQIISFPLSGPEIKCRWVHLELPLNVPNGFLNVLFQWLQVSKISVKLPSFRVFLNLLFQYIAYRTEKNVISNHKSELLIEYEVTINEKDRC
jgi:hypothetical protein